MAQTRAIFMSLVLLVILEPLGVDLSHASSEIEKPVQQRSGLARIHS